MHDELAKRIEPQKWLELTADIDSVADSLKRAEESSTGGLSSLVAQAEAHMKHGTSLEKHASRLPG